MIRTRVLLLCALAVLSAGGFVRSGATEAVRAAPSVPYEAAATNDEPTTAIKHSNLSSELEALAGTADMISTAGGDPSAAAIAYAAPELLRYAIDGGQVRIDDSARVAVYVETRSSVEDLLRVLIPFGGRIEHSDSKFGIVQVQLPIAALRSVASQPGVDLVRTPDYPVSNAGQIMTEGDPVINAELLRSNIPGIDGFGVTVGVIADGVRGLEDAQAIGDLPVVDTSTCNVAEDHPELDPDPASRGAEGTAMLEIVHDVAPGAALMFGYFGFDSGLMFNEAVSCLADHADIIVDDIGFYGAGPYDGTSYISLNTADELNGNNRVQAYVTAAGNQAGRHYQGTFVDSGFSISYRGDTWFAHQFDEDDPQYTIEHFGLVNSPANFNRVQLEAGGELQATLVWNDPWNSSHNDYDLFFSDGTQIRPCQSVLSPQDGNDHPVENCLISNNTGSTRNFDIFIANRRGEAQARVMDLFVPKCFRCVFHGNGTYLDFTTRESSIGNQSDAGGSPVSVITVGAVRYQSPTGIEVFSSRGPTEDRRLKPDIVAPDNVCVTGSGGFGSASPSCQTFGHRFLGTSAAAPHVAAVAALLLQCDPSLSRAELRNAVVDTATDIAEPGPDNTYGHGLVDAVAGAIGVGYCGAPTPTASPTPTPSNTPTATDTRTITPTATDTPLAPDTPTITPTVSATRTATITPTPRPLIGDVNCDNSVNAIDAALILQLSASLLSALACQSNADVNVDGSISSIDAALILQLVAGLLDTLPP